MASTGTSEEYSMAILYLRFKELSKFLIQEESDQKEKAKNPHPYIPPFNAAVVALANTLLAESAEEEPKHKRIALTNHVVEITEKTDVMGNVREEDPFDYNFSSAFSRQQLAPILQPRQDSDVSFRNFPYSDEDTKLLSSSLEKLAIMDNPNVETALIEVPRHTISLFLPHRIVFDDPFDSFVYVFSKKEFEDFKTRVESRVVAQHEKGPIGIGKSLLAYTYAAYCKYKSFQRQSEDIRKAICIYQAVQSEIVDEPGFSNLLFKEILNCLSFALPKATFGRLRKSLLQKDQFTTSDRELICDFIRSNRIRTVFLIDNYNLLTFLLNSGDQLAKNVNEFILDWLPRNISRSSLVFISSNNNINRKFKENVVTMPFQKKHAFEPTEVLLYLSIFAPNMVAMKLGETDTVTLNYSDFMTSAKCRLSFFHDTGFVPLIMRVAINECKEPLPIDSAVFLEDQCQAIQENLMEFSCSEPHSSFGTYEKHRFAQVSAVVFEQALKEKLSRKEVVHDVLFRIIVGLPIPDSQQKYVDQRFFVRSLTERSNIYDPLYPAVLKCARNYLAEDKSLPNVIASHLEESKEKHRPASERGYILERLFVLTCHAHVTALHSKFEAKVAGGNSYLNFNMVPQIKQFHGVFPDIKESGIYWSISPTYPFVEGFFYNGKILAGIQVTVRAPKEHSSNKVPTRRTMELLEKIADFCEPRKIGFSLVYAVPKEQFEKLDVFNLLEIESFAACQGSSSFCPSPFV